MSRVLERFLRPPRVALEPVGESVDLERAAVFRFAAGGGFVDDAPVTIIGPSAAPGRAIAGPPGFALIACRISPRSELARAAGSADVALHVVEGEVRVTMRGEVTELGLRDTQLLAAGASFSVRAVGSRPATVVELRMTRRDVTDAAGMAPGVARASQMVAIRERIPIRWLPRLHDILSPRTLYPVIGSHRRGPARFELRGPRGLSVGLASTPRGTGPALHVHRYSTEMFLVLAGRFRVTWGEAGEHGTVLDPLDAVVMPRGVNRAFEAVGDEESWVLPIVVGASNEADDIVFLADVERRLQEAGSRFLIRLAAAAGLRFGERNQRGEAPPP